MFLTTIVATSFIR